MNKISERALQALISLALSSSAIGCAQSTAPDEGSPPPIRESAQELESEQAAPTILAPSSRPAASSDEREEKIARLMASANDLSDGGVAQHEALLLEARQDGTAQALAAELEQLPSDATEALGKKQLLASLLGSVGGDQQVDLLASIAAEDRGLPDVLVDETEAGDEHEDEDQHDHSSRYAERAVLRRVAVYALGHLSDRGHGTARAAVRQLLTTAQDPEIAKEAGMTLFMRGTLTEGDRQQLERRGLPGAFRRLSEEDAGELSKLPPDNLEKFQNAGLDSPLLLPPPDPSVPQ